MDLLTIQDWSLDELQQFAEYIGMVGNTRNPYEVLAFLSTKGLIKDTKIGDAIGNDSWMAFYKINNTSESYDSEKRSLSIQSICTPDRDNLINSGWSVSVDYDVMILKKELIEKFQEDDVTHWHFRIGKNKDKNNDQFREVWVTPGEHNEENPWWGFPCYIQNDVPDGSSFRAYFAQSTAEEMVRRNTHNQGIPGQHMYWASPKKDVIVIIDEEQNKEFFIKKNEFGLYVANPQWGWAEVEDGWSEPKPQPGGGGGEGEGEGGGDSESEDPSDNDDENDGEDADDSEGNGDDEADDENDQDNSGENDGGKGEEPEEDDDPNENNEKGDHKPTTKVKYHEEENNGKGKPSGGYKNKEEYESPPPPELEEIKLLDNLCPKCGNPPTVPGSMTNYCAPCDNVYHASLLSSG